MTHNNVYRLFKHYFPDYDKRTSEWFPNGKNSIRIRLIDKQQFIFTLVGKSGIRFETVDSFLERTKVTKGTK